MTSIWTTLGIARTGDRNLIRRAYAAKLKATNPEDDPEGFKALREAYERALQQAGTVARIPGVAVRQIEAGVPDEPEPQPSPPPEPSPVPAQPVAGGTVPDVSDTPSRDSGPVVPGVVRTRPDPAFIHARRDLEALLKPASNGDDDARRDALKTLFACPDLESIDTREETEGWLLRLIVFNAPRSDVLIGPARKYFGWNEDAIDWPRRRDNGAPLKQRLFARERDVAYLALLASPRSPHHAAYKVLSRPPEPEILWTRVFPPANPKEIGNLLRDIRHERPHLEGELDAEAVALWKKRGERPRLEGNNLLVALVALPALASLAAFRLLPPIDSETMAMIAFALILPTLWTVGWCVRTYLYVLPRRRWRQGEGAPPWMAYGWGPALLGVFVIGAGPPTLWLAGVQLVLALAVAWWAMVVGEPDRRPGKTPWQLRLLGATGSLIPWWLFAMRGLPGPESKVMMTIACAAAVPVFGYGWIPLNARWSQLSRGLRRKGLVGLAATCGMALAFNWIVLGAPEWQPLAFALTAGFLLLHKVPTLAGQQWSVGLANRIVGAIVLFAFGISSSWAGTAAFGSLLLLRAIVNCISAHAKLDEKPKKRPGLA